MIPHHQVAVVREGRVLLDVAAGVRGAVDPRPVYNDTLFPVLDLGAWGVWWVYISVCAYMHTQ